MANALYPKAKEAMLNAAVDLNTASIKVALVRGYSYNSAHEFVSDVTGAGGTLHSTSSALTSPTIVNGTFDAADLTFSSVTANASNHSLLIFQSSAVTGGADVAASAQRLIAFLDTGTGLPIVPPGGDIVVTWSGSGIFSL